MLFFNRLRDLMTKNRPSTPSRRRKSMPANSSIFKPMHNPVPPVEPASNHQQSHNDSAPIASAEENSTPTQSGSAVMLVLYLDDQNHSLAKPQWLNGQIGEKIHFKPRQIANYVLFHIIGFTTVFTNSYRIMTLQFTKKMGHPAIMYAIDYDTSEMIAPPVIQTGAVNAPFAFGKSEVDDYHLVKASRPLTGHFTEEVQTIVVLLRRNNWTAVQRINIFVKLLDSTQILDQPDGQPYDYEFPKNSVWRAFVRVNTRNGETWFNLGGPQWVNGKKVTQTDQPARPQIGQRPAVVYEPMNQAAKIDFVTGHSLHTYDQPNGQAVKLVADGSPVQLTGEFTDDNDIKWYRMADNTVVLAQYVQFN
ncbi:MucBP domain-containing protein [Lactobacillus sp. LC28-10]|uniref:MucBP domain-containing protein n=1 Tax=Secundilactobacillus angelensis TaxID=2722706 RepID=A0ABX1KXA1_9LACO|nr:MucBP domain-containing protein [Secundilactobacillus angelensis]MCH5462565.1 MucBP domain-containing protein [Secundilactobacillus angelensis]NLR18244.1 MucBP domain-containing protein [Secundilactobacillus angelensis]